jgi:RHS repeat-associated protein
MTQYAYNNADRLTRITYPSGMVVDYTLDAAGRIIALDKTVDGVTESLISGAQHEPFGPVSSFNYGNGLSYNATLDLDYELDQLQSGNDLNWLLGYDPVGNILAIADQASPARDQVFSYDSLYRLDTAQGGYGNENFDYDGNGNRTRYQNGIVDDTYTYEPQSNRLVTQNGWAFSRDPAGNRTARLDAGGFGQFYSYADHNRLAQVTLRDGSGEAVVGDYTYDGRGQRVAKTVDGITIHYIYGLSGELLGEYVVGELENSTEYAYLNGQPIAVMRVATDAYQPPSIEVVLDNGDAGTSSSGSWQSKTDAQDYAADYLFASKSAGTSYRWTVTPPGNTYDVYAWWVEHNSHSDTVTYTIRYGTGETDTVVKSHKSGGGEWQHLGSYYSTDGGDYVEVSSGANRFVADAIRWVHVPDPVVTQTKSTHFIHFDHLGTPRQVSDENQTVIWRWDSRPFGDSLPDEDPDGDLESFTLNLRFPGQYFDEETGLHYNYFRDYDPSTGRYIESDPIGMGGGLNTYGYVSQNPMGFIDPSGLQVAPPIFIPHPIIGPIVVVEACSDDEDEKCEKATREARSRYHKLITKRIPQFQGGGTRDRDPDHLTSILQLQNALRDAIRRVRLHCKVLPVELPEWERAANLKAPGF